MGMFDFLTNNKQLPGKWDYQGKRPPSIGDSLRPVQTMITDTLMRRSQGQDVGFDPKRREELGKIYDIDFNRQQDTNKNDLMNQLSGTGQSKNLAARDALLGQAQRYGQDTRSKYMMGLDVEDLTARNQEKREATGQLGDLNRFNFGQEDVGAQFDLNEYSKGQQFDLDRAQQYDNPWAAAIRSASNIAGTAAQFFPGSSAGGMGSGGFQEKAGTSGSFGTDIGTTSGKGVRQNYFNSAPKRVLKA